MANASQSFAVSGTGAGKTFDLTDMVPQREKYLTVYRNGSDIGSGNWSLSGLTVTVASTLTDGDTILIQRDTDQSDSDFLVQFSDPSTLRAVDLQEAIDQLLHICQEIYEGGANTDNFMTLDTASETYWDADSKHIKSGPDQASDFSGEGDGTFITKAYADNLVISAGNLPTVTTADEGEGLYVNQSGSWASQKRYLETNHYTVHGPGPVDVGVADGEITKPTLTTVGSDDYIDVYGSYWVGSTDMWDGGGSGSYIGDDLALEFHQHAQYQDLSLQGLGVPGVSLNANGKDFTVVKVLGGWHFELELIVFAYLRNEGTSWNNSLPPTLKLSLWDTVRNAHVNIADLNTFYPGEITIEPTGLGTAGNMTFPHNDHIEVGHLLEAGGNYTRSLTNGGGYTSRPQVVRWTGMIPCANNVNYFQFRAVNYDTGANDWTCIGRPSTLRITTNPGFTPV